MKEKDYWDYRGQISYTYKGETFYTITPIPYYYARRKSILSLLFKYMKRKKFNRICDFGCGDSAYILKLIKKGLKCDIDGTDISDEMILRSQENCKAFDNVHFFLSDGNGIGQNTTYDCIYSTAVFAHIEDEIVGKIFDNLSSHLQDNGYFLFCEQVGKKHIKGETYIRRTIDEYKNLLNNNGYKIENIILIDYWLHRMIFERKIAKKFYDKIDVKDNSKKRIIANTLPKFRMLSKLFTILSFPHIFNNATSGWGYAFFVAKKDIYN